MPNTVIRIIDPTSGKVL